MVGCFGWLFEDNTEMRIGVTVFHWRTHNAGIVRGISADKDWLWLEFEDGSYDVRRSSAFVRVPFPKPATILRGP